MPIYQYQCLNCDHKMEALQKMSDPVLVDCPSCTKPSLKKQLTAASFKLKGTGWYETDFKNSGKPKEKVTNTSSNDSTSSSSTNSSSDNSSSTTKTDTTSTSKESI